VARLKSNKGPYAWAGQYQQSPEPRGGGILKREWWQPWPPEDYLTPEDGKLRFPLVDYIIAWLDSAYTEKTENDPSAMVVFGIFKRYGIPKVILMEGWNERLEFHELVKKVITTANKREIDMLLIEGKASGKSVAQEVRRLCGEEQFTVKEMNPERDKYARAHSIVPLLASESVYVPCRDGQPLLWADNIINECSVFPKGKHDDYVDCISGGLGYLRKSGLALLPAEGELAYTAAHMFRGQEDDEPLYDV
jgi:predicted phage terminase large subunit-like protein